MRLGTGQSSFNDGAFALALRLRRIGVSRHMGLFGQMIQFVLGLLQVTAGLIFTALRQSALPCRIPCSGVPGLGG